MKKISASLIIMIMVIVACQKEQAKTPISSSPEEQNETISQRKCATNEVLDRQLKEDPSLQKRMADIEQMTRNFLAEKGSQRLVNGVITIPVVVHVVYNSIAENISATQVQSQIDVLNEDFNNTNGDRSLVPAEFTDEQTSIGIKFVLDRIVRVKTSKKSWGTTDAVKKSQMGGSNPVDPSTYLNMWACNLGQGILGYAQFPGGSAATDGVVILYSAFGRTGTLIPTYNRGRTATHEVGHWMNLRHIWGDASCGNDLVADTPPAATANYGCPSYPKRSTCSGNLNEMTMNYMDYTDDACMYMFTNGQKGRTLAIFSPGGARYSMAQ